MPYAEWNPTLETGVELLDDQHKRLFALINALHEAIHATGDEYETVADALYELTEYVTEHFEDEEALMEANGYELLAAHHEMHRRLTQKTLGYMARYVNGDTVSLSELVEFLNSWLQSHIVEQDCHFTSTVAR